MSHITNLSVNKRMKDHPGQIPVNVNKEYPDAFSEICSIWAAVVAEAHIYMDKQRSEKHFEFFGIDIIVDSSGDCWLIEINRLPGLESSNNRMKEFEDTLYDNMMTRLLEIVLCTASEGNWSSEFDMAQWIVVREGTEGSDSLHGTSREVNDTRDSSCEKGTDECFINVLKWKMYTRKVRSHVLVEQM